MYSSNEQSVSLINFISIIMSMIVVTSKGTILSYSIYRSAAIFNFLCFAIDIFGIFCVVSWLFCADPDINDDDLFEYILYGYKMWSASYYYFKILLTIFKCIAIAACCAICASVSCGYQQCGNQPWRRIIEIPIAGCIITLIFFPVAIICLMVRFTLLPLLVLRAFDHSQNASFQYYNSIFSFLTDSSSILEMHEKLLLSHWLFADSLCINHDLYHSKYMCRDIQQRYIETQSISLSFLYTKLNCQMLAQYHQTLEVITLLCSRKGVWAFLFVKIMFMLRLNSQNNRHLKFIVQCFYYILRIMYVPLEMDDICFLWNNNGVLTETQQAKFDALGAVFHETVKDIQNIINWEHLTQRIQEIVDDVLSIDVKQHWVQIKAEIAYEWSKYRDKYTAHYIQSHIVNGVRWFFADGLYLCVKQDVINIYNRMCGKETKHISKWNFPRCWSSFSIMFGSKNSDHGAGGAAYSYNLYWCAYEYIDPLTCYPWIGRGICVFMVVICYKCIHDPIRWCVSSQMVENIAVFIAAACGVFVVLLVLLLALYSVFLPIIFLIQHVWHYGICLEHNALQIILTLFYFVILSVMIGLFSRVWKFVYCDIHLYRFFGNEERIPQKYAQLAIETYRNAPIRNQIVMERFGSDLGQLLLMFLPKWHILNDRDDIDVDIQKSSREDRGQLPVYKNSPKND